MPEGLIKVSSALFDALLPMVKQQVASQIRVRDISNASVSIAPAEFSSWEAAREALIAEQTDSLRREHSQDIAAASSDEEVAELEQEFTAKQAAIEAEVDSTKNDLHLELEYSFNFLSNGNECAATLS